MTKHPGAKHISMGRGSAGAAARGRMGVRGYVFTAPQSFGQGTCLWVCLLEFYFALFGDRVVQVGIKLEILSSAS